VTEKRRSVGEKEPFLTREHPIATSRFIGAWRKIMF
jgi:hypothetical protein